MPSSYTNRSQSRPHNKSIHDDNDKSKVWAANLLQNNHLAVSIVCLKSNFGEPRTMEAWPMRPADRHRNPLPSRLGPPIIIHLWIHLNKPDKCSQNAKHPLCVTKSTTAVDAVSNGFKSAAMYKGIIFLI